MQKKVLRLLDSKGAMSYSLLLGAFGASRADDTADAIQALLEQGSIRWAESQDKLEVAP